MDNTENFDEGITQVAPEGDFKALKTLKDLVVNGKRGCPTFVFEDDVRVEAMKWIKTLESMEYRDLNGKEYEPNSMEFYMLRKFFNLDDVKQKQDVSSEDSE